MNRINIYMVVFLLFLSGFLFSQGKLVKDNYLQLLGQPRLAVGQMESRKK